MNTLIVFQTITSLTIIISCLAIYLRTRELFELSLQKGLRYFSRAFLWFAVSFTARYINAILLYLDIYNSWNLLIGGISIWGGAAGGFYLAYSLVWRHFEHDRIKRSHPWRNMVIVGLALLIAVIEISLILIFNVRTQYVLFCVMLVLLSYALFRSCKNTCLKRKDPFTSSVGLGFIVYLAIPVGDIFSPILPTVFYYVWGVVTIFFVAVAHNVSRIR